MLFHQREIYKIAAKINCKGRPSQPKREQKAINQYIAVMKSSTSGVKKSVRLLYNLSGCFLVQIKGSNYPSTVFGPRQSTLYWHVFSPVYGFILVYGL